MRSSFSFTILSSILAAVTALPVMQRDNCGCVSTPGDARQYFLRELLQRSPEYGNFDCARSICPLKVGIVGAGASGIHAGMILESLDIDYEILEGSSRIGGRLYSHRFEEAAWNKSNRGEPDYYNYYVSFVHMEGFKALADKNRTWVPCASQACRTWIV